MASLNDNLRNRNLTLAEALRQPVTELIGIDAAKASALRLLGINSVFDLGTSQAFAAAREVLRAASGNGLGVTDGLFPGDLLINPSYESVTEIPDLSIQHLRALRGISDGEIDEIANALSIRTIRDFALWPHQSVARLLVGEASGATVDPEELQTEELRPRMGQYPTERVYYNTLAMFRFLGESDPLGEELKTSISLETAVRNPQGINRPGVGAYLTFAQSWYSQGITLGHLLHSLALAPGEATRIAVVDWTRRTSAFTAESISETEQLANETSHSRALSEVQSAVAREFQSGASRTSSAASSESGAVAASASTGLLTSLYASADVTGNYQSAASTSEADSSSWSKGTKQILGKMEQRISESTEQHASSARSRRASAVREVAQSEHEQLSTRVVANYNHMHALTIQYFEVVQIYRTQVHLVQADRCLFIPLETLEFRKALPANATSDEKRAELNRGWSIVERFRPALVRAALNPRIRSLLIDDTTTVEIRPTVSTRIPWLIPERMRVTRAENFLQPMRNQGIDAAEVAPNIPLPQAANSVKMWDLNEINAASRVFDRVIVRPGSNAIHVSDDTELQSLSFVGLSVGSVVLKTAGNSEISLPVQATTQSAALTPSVRLGSIKSLNVAMEAGVAKTGRLILGCSYLGRTFELPAIPLDIPAGSGLHDAVRFTTDESDRRSEVLEHLQLSREYYSKAIARQLDTPTILAVLGHYHLNGKPLIDLVEPKPIRVVGNYLVFLAPVDPDDDHDPLLQGNNQGNWQQILEDNDLTLNKPGKERLIPIPTGGVFAEAVLGRSNCAEKLDITRFWNWQDSPIPLQPSEIAALQSGSRATTEDLKPGQLSQPVLNIVNPTTLPNPTGLGAAFGALQNLGFRDMSGLAGTQALAQAAQQGVVTATTEAGQLAAQNMATEAQKAVAMGQIAADLVKSVIGAPGGSSVQGISGLGARINQGKSLDQRGISGANVPGDKQSQSDVGSGEQSLNSPSTNPFEGSGVETTPTTAHDFSREAAYSDVGSFGISPAAFHDIAGTIQASSQGTRPAPSGTPNPSKPFATTPLTLNGLGLTRNAGLAAKLTQLATQVPNAGLAFLNRTTREFASVNGGKLALAASISKLGIAIAAFRLRESVKQYCAASSAGDLTTMINEIELAWKPAVQAVFPRQAASFPKLRRIFVFSQSAAGRWDAEFDSTPTSNLPQAPGSPCDPSLAFYQRLEAMLSISNNAAATLCLDDLGLLYTQAAIEAEGFSVKNGLGIWIGKGFREGSPMLWWPPVVGGPQSATPDALIMLTTALDAGQLVSSFASTELKRFLAASGSWTREAFRPAGITTVVEFAKDGKGADNNTELFSDLAACSKADGAKYAGVFLSVAPFSKVSPLAEGFDGMI